MVKREDLREQLEPLILAGEYVEAQKIITKVLSKDESAALKAEAKLQRAQIRIIKGDWDIAEDELQEAARLAEGAGEYEVLSDCHNALADLNHDQGKTDELQLHLTKALELARDHSYARGQSEALHGMGLLALDRGEYDAALEYHQRALQLCREAGWRAGEGNIIGDMANVLYAKRELQEGLESRIHSLQILREVNDRRNEAVIVSNMGLSWLTQGEVDRAAESFRQALEINREIECALGEGFTILNMGFLAAERGEFDQALLNCTQSLAIAERLGSPRLRRYVLYVKGFTLVRQEALEAAIEPLQQALEIGEQLGLVPIAAHTGLALGVTLRRLRRYDDAEAVLSAAKASLEQVGDELGARAAAYAIESIDREKEPEGVTEEQKAVDELADVLPELKEMWKAAGGKQRQLESYLTRDPADEENRFVVLKQWNSFTPIFAFRPDKAKGGGYYLNWRGRGLAIDPGFSFIENLYAEGFSMADLDAVLITHAHLDHTSDMEPLLDLLHQCTELQSTVNAGTTRNPVRSKSLDFFLNLSSFCKFSESLAHCDGLGSLHPLRAGQRFEPEGYDLAIVPVAAKHEELGKRHVAVGLVIELLDRDRNCLCRVGITGDSGYRGKTWARKFAGLDVLVAHIGAISEDEVLKGGLYDNHLGFRGLFRLCQVLRDDEKLPRVLLISEFGEELKGFRLRIAELLQDKVPSSTQVFAADVGLRVQLSPSRDNIYILCGEAHPGKDGCISAADTCAEREGRLVPLCARHAEC
jgi:tetratricopeptide (TPR) repeat protein